MALLLVLYSAGLASTGETLLLPTLVGLIAIIPLWKLWRRQRDFDWEFLETASLPLSGHRLTLRETAVGLSLVLILIGVVIGVRLLLAPIGAGGMSSNPVVPPEAGTGLELWNAYYAQWHLFAIFDQVFTYGIGFLTLTLGVSILPLHDKWWLLDVPVLPLSVWIAVESFPNWWSYLFVIVACWTAIDLWKAIRRNPVLTRLLLVDGSELIGYGAVGFLAAVIFWKLTS